mgnify:CR=1 FL=1
MRIHKNTKSGIQLNINCSCRKKISILLDKNRHISCLHFGTKENEILLLSPCNLVLSQSLNFKNISTTPTPNAIHLLFGMDINIHDRIHNHVKQISTKSQSNYFLNFFFNF